MQSNYLLDYSEKEISHAYIQERLAIIKAFERVLLPGLPKGLLGYEVTNITLDEVRPIIGYEIFPLAISGDEKHVREAFLQVVDEILLPKVKVQG
jgi:hypothetical protein